MPQANLTGFSRWRIQFNPAIECRNHQRKATGHLITSSARYRTGRWNEADLFCRLRISRFSRGFRTCNGSLTSWGPFASRLCDTPGVAFRFSLWRRHPGLSLTRPATMPARPLSTLRGGTRGQPTHDSSPGGWLTLSRAELPSANNPPVYPGAQGE
jgi:hypothetical protein